MLAGVYWELPTSGSYWADELPQLKRRASLARSGSFKRSQSCDTDFRNTIGRRIERTWYVKFCKWPVPKPQTTSSQFSHSGLVGSAGSTRRSRSDMTTAGTHTVHDARLCMRDSPGLVGSSRSKRRSRSASKELLQPAMLHESVNDRHGVGLRERWRRHPPL